MEGKVTRLCLCGDIEIDEQVVRILHLTDLLDGHSFIFLHREGRFRNLLAIEHNLKLGVLHSGIPERRIDSLDVCCVR